MLYERHPSEFKPYNISEEKVWTLHGDINKISTSKKYTRNSLQKITVITSLSVTINRKKYWRGTRVFFHRTCVFPNKKFVVFGARDEISLKFRRGVFIRFQHAIWRLNKLRANREKHVLINKVSFYRQIFNSFLSRRKKKKHQLNWQS